MNQVFTVDHTAVLTAVRNAGLFTGACTTQRFDGTAGSTGRPALSVDANWDAVETAIPCMIGADGVASKIRNSFEKKSDVADMQTDILHVLLDGYYPGILHGDRAVLTRGATSIGTFDIQGVEHSTDNVMTRLAVHKVAL